MSIFGSKNHLILKYFLNNKNVYSSSILYNTNNYSRILDKNLGDQQTRNTSTTSSSKGQAYSIPNLPGTSLHVSPNTNEKSKLDLTFENSQLAFKAKSSLDLLRGYLVFQLCSFNFLINNQKQVLVYLKNNLKRF